MRQLDAIAHVIKPKSRIKKIPTMHYGKGTEDVVTTEQIESFLSQFADEIAEKQRENALDDAWSRRMMEIPPILKTLPGQYQNYYPEYHDEVPVKRHGGHRHFDPSSLGEYPITAQQGMERVPDFTGYKGGDTIDARLTPHESVLNRNASELFGRHNIRTMNDVGNMLAACGVDLAGGKRGYQMGSEDIEPGILPGNIPANEGQQWAPKGNSNQVQIFGGRLSRPDFSGYRGDLNPIDNRSYNGMLNNLFGGFGRAPWFGAPGWNNFTAFNPPGGFQGAGQGPTNIPSYFNAQGYPMAQLAGSPDAILQKQHFGFKKNK